MHIRSLNIHERIRGMRQVFRLLCLITFSLLLQSWSMAQISERIPLVFRTPTDLMAKGNVVYDEALLSNKVSQNNSWFVFAIEEGQVGDKPFMTKFRVTGRSGETLTIVDHRDQTYAYQVELKELLPWERSVINSTTRYKVKYLPISKIGDAFKGDEIIFYRGPSTDKINFTTKAFEGFWYLYLQRGDWSLVGKTSSIGPGSPNPKNFGWIETARLQKWDQRLVLLPNQSSTAITQRKGGKYYDQVAAFTTEVEADNYASQSPSERKSVFRQGAIEEFNQPWGADELRWPVLDIDLESINESTNIYKVGIIGSSDLGKGEKGKQTVVADFKQSEFQSLRSMIAKQRLKSQRVDVVFVIDATQSMGPYIDAVKDALMRLSIELLNDKQNEYRFGAVLYTSKDETDPKRLRKRSLVEEGNIHLLQDFLRRNDDFYEHDITFREGVVEGLMEGVGLLSNDPRRNFIIHIADAGADDYDQKAALVDQLIKYDASLISVQISNHLDRGTGLPIPAYQDLHTQMRDIIKDYDFALTSALKQFVSPKVAEYVNLGSDNNQTLSFQKNSSTNKYASFRTDLRRHLTMSQVIACYPGNQINTGELVNLLTESIKATDTLITQFLDAAESLRAEGFKDGEANKLFGPMILNYYKNEVGMTQEELERWVLSGSEAMIELYVPFKSSNPVAQPLLEFALFIDEQELGALVETLEPLGKMDYQDAEEYTETLMASFRQFAALYVDEDNLDDSQVNNLINGIIGIPSSSINPFRRIIDEASSALGISVDLFKISDIRNLHVEAQQNFVDDLNKMLDNILGQRIKTYSHGQAFYWIPQRAFEIK